VTPLTQARTATRAAAYVFQGECDFVDGVPHATVVRDGDPPNVEHYILARHSAVLSMDVFCPAP
jgi:hypothetical protein